MFLETGIIGGIIGLVGRLAPEVLKFFKSKDELAHEIKMLEIQADLEKTRGENRIEEKYVDYSISGLQAIAESAKAEAELAKNNYKWVNALISSQRPYVTFFMFNLYMIVKLTLIWYGIDAGVEMIELLANAWKPEDAGLLSMIVGYLFVDRSIQKYKKD